MAELCDNCGKPALVNLNTWKHVDDGSPGPDLWLCAECLTRGMNTPVAHALMDAEEEIEEYREAGRRLN
jgi:hypothetical protein